MPRESGPAGRAGPSAPSGNGHRGASSRRRTRPGQDTFAELADRYRGTIHLLCYRLVGSFDAAVRLTNDTLLTAWRCRDSAPAGWEDWLLAMTVRASIDDVRRRRPQPLRPGQSCVPRSDVTWLQPYPDRLLPDDVHADAIGLPYIRGSQSLFPHDRAALVLADVHGWPPRRIARALRVPMDNVAPRLERARATLGVGGIPATEALRSENVMTTLVDGFTRADVQEIARVVRDDVEVTMPPLPFTFNGRDSVLAVLAHVFRVADPTRRGRRHCIPTRANLQPAIAVYVQRHPGRAFHGHELIVARIASNKIVELTVFEPCLLPAFGLPTELPADGLPAGD